MSTSSLASAYTEAQAVYEGKLSAQDAISKLTSESGINEASASYAVRVFRHLMQGEVFKRGLSAPDMDAFLAGILRDYGRKQLRVAVRALWLHVGYYEAKRSTTLHSLRLIAAKHQAQATAEDSLETSEQAFRTAVGLSMHDSTTARDARLQLAPKMPGRTVVTVVAFERNPDVVAAVLLRAGDACERCNKPAPFYRRKDKTPYLEVHHKRQLAHGGEDTVGNAEALCPNCHRELHYGASAA